MIARALKGVQSLQLSLGDLNSESIRLLALGFHHSADSIRKSSLVPSDLGWLDASHDRVLSGADKGCESARSQATVAEDPD